MENAARFDIEQTPRDAAASGPIISRVQPQPDAHSEQKIFSWVLLVALVIILSPSLRRFVVFLAKIVGGSCLVCLALLLINWLRRSILGMLRGAGIKWLDVTFHPLTWLTFSVVVMFMGDYARPAWRLPAKVSFGILAVFTILVSVDRRLRSGGISCSNAVFHPLTWLVISVVVMFMGDYARPAWRRPAKISFGILAVFAILVSVHRHLRSDTTSEKYGHAHIQSAAQGDNFIPSTLTSSPTHYRALAVGAIIVGVIGFCICCMFLTRRLRSRPRLSFYSVCEQCGHWSFLRAESHHCQRTKAAMPFTAKSQKVVREAHAQSSPKRWSSQSLESMLRRVFAAAPDFKLSSQQKKETWTVMIGITALTLLLIAIDKFFAASSVPKPKVTPPKPTTGPGWSSIVGLGLILAGLCAFLYSPAALAVELATFKSRPDLDSVGSLDRTPETKDRSLQTASNSSTAQPAAKLSGVDVPEITELNTFADDIFRQSRYEYKKLEGNDIRLLQILPNDDPFAEIECIMSHKSLSNPPDYVALSYAWGDKQRDCKAWVDGVIMGISTNLDVALRAMRQREKLCIWTDAICINQREQQHKKDRKGQKLGKDEKDEKDQLGKEAFVERNAQVLRMFQIYRKAKEVAVWLGEADEHSDIVMRQLSEGMIKNAVLWGNLPMVSIEAFFRRKYWTRIWIIQEIIVGANVTVHCGELSVDWKQIDELATASADRAASFPQAGTLVKLQRDWRQSPPSLLEILLRTSRSVCSDEHPQDKVYGLLGLASYPKHFVPEPDYSLKPAELCINLVQDSMIGRPGDIIFLAPQQLSPKGEKTGLTLPSWCPDFLHLDRKPYQLEMARYIARDTPKFRAGIHDKQWYATGDSITMLKSRDKRRLLLRGVPCGVIKSLGALNVNDHNFPKSQFASAASSDFNIYQDLCRLLSMYDRKYPKPMDTSTVLSFLDSMPFRMFASTSKGDGSRVRDWFRCNEDFMVQGKTLKRRAANGPRGSTLVAVVKGSPINFSEFDFRRLSSAIADIVKERMRIMALAGGQVGWAHPRAELGDEIYLVAGCSMPVILRPRSSQRGHTLVGHSYVQGFMDGKYWQSSVNERDLQDIEIW